VGSKRDRRKTNQKELPVRIKPGEYEAVCYDVELGWCFGRRSAYAHFRIISGECEGEEVTMVCSYPEAQLSYRSKIFVQCTMAMGRRPASKERVTPKVLMNKMYRILVRDTDRKFDGTNIRMPSFAQYSVVDTILETLTGVPQDV
jgi:hypothetical protein